MPKMNKKLRNFYGTLSHDEAVELYDRFFRVGFKRNFKDALILTNVCELLAGEMAAETDDAKWMAVVVKEWVANNTRLWSKFIEYVNNTIGVKYNEEKNRVVVAPEYWSIQKKETEEHRLFREFGYPMYKEWTKIMQVHQPAEVLFVETGSGPSTPIVVQDGPFDPECPDTIDVYFPKVKRPDPIPFEKLTKFS